MKTKNRILKPKSTMKSNDCTLAIKAKIFLVAFLFSEKPQESCFFHSIIFNQERVMVFSTRSFNFITNISKMFHFQTEWQINSLENSG